MKRPLTDRQLLLSILGLVYDKSQKEVGARVGIDQKDVSKLLRRRRSREMKDELYERLLAAMAPLPPGAVPVVTGCLEALDGLEREGDLSPQERAEVEAEVLAAARRQREGFAEAIRLSRAGPPQGYPEAHDLAPARARAEVLFRRLARLSPEDRLAVVQVADEYQTWALCERACAASVEANSGDLDAAGAWAGLAAEIAERVRGPEGFRLRIEGYAGAHVANALRVAGELPEADAAFARSNVLWLTGTDPLGVLDPGRLLDLEASLRRAQRRLSEALALLKEAAAVGRQPERVLINKGFTLEVMGEHGLAVETLQEAMSVVERAGSPRLLYMARFNLAVSLCHLGHCDEAAELLDRVRPVVAELGDEIEIVRVTWLEGKIAAADGRRVVALALLAETRRGFVRRGMSYDVALVLLEEMALHLDEGRTLEVKELTGELAAVFVAKGVHREALAALRLFAEAAEREVATAELARRVLAFVSRARYDREARFPS